MAASVELIDPRQIHANKDNPRLIFRVDELDALESSISQQGILVPLTVYKDGRTFTLLDGERRWRCAIKLGLGKVPVIIQDKPNRITNIMMMFAIHNARRDWDPLPTALKLQELEKELSKGLDRNPTETELAAAASISKGEVRRYRKILNLPIELRKELLEELKKPRHEQRLTVDHIIESTSGVAQLERRGIISRAEAEPLVKAVVDKFRTGQLKSTVEPRKLARVARAFERGEVTRDVVRKGLDKVRGSSTYTIDTLYRDTVEYAEFEHSSEQLIRRVIERVGRLAEQRSIQSESLRNALSELKRALANLNRR